MILPCSILIDRVVYVDMLSVYLFLYVYICSTWSGPPPIAAGSTSKTMQTWRRLLPWTYAHTQASQLSTSDAQRTDQKKENGTRRLTYIFQSFSFSLTTRCGTMASTQNIPVMSPPKCAQLSTLPPLGDDLLS